MAINDVNTLITLLRSRVNIQDAVQLLSADILECINGAQERMVQASHEWSVLEQIWQTTLPANTESILQPPSVMQIMRVFQKDETQSDPTLSLSPLTPTTRDQWFDRITMPDVSRTFVQPSITGAYYYLFDDRLFVVPVSSAPITLVIDYKGPPPDLVIDTAGKPNTFNYFTQHFFRTLKWGAEAELWHHLGQDDMRAYAEGRFELSFAKARNTASALQASGPPKHRGI